ncbi:retrovirus-related Pol polyprotein from transposon 412 [Trichonephila clavipes]|nr:retrovirus-related Pol polyprotein from transposon 412 [Trichonephila clavipes]
MTLSSWGAPFEEHVKNIRRVLKSCKKEANLKIKAIQVPPRFRREVTYLGHIISRRKVPLRKLAETKQKIIWIWLWIVNNPFNKLKDALTSAPILAYPEIGKQFILDTDASHESIGAVLSQDIDGQERGIAYFFSYFPNQKEIIVCPGGGTARYRKSRGTFFHPYL